MQLTNDQKILQSIVKKAWDDPTFKSSLINSPLATIESFLGHPINLPQGKSLAVVDQTDSTTIFINLPAEPDFEDMELNEEMLDYVSGGDGEPVIVKPSNLPDGTFGGS